MSILAIGDYGNGNEGQYTVSHLLNHLSKKYDTKLILGLVIIYIPRVSENNIQFQTNFTTLILN